VRCLDFSGCCRFSWLAPGPPTRSAAAFFSGISAVLLITLIVGVLIYIALLILLFQVLEV
jgi:hypothetical protein